MTDWIWKLRDTDLFDVTYRRTRDALSGPGWGGFHRDRIYRALMLDLLDTMPFSSFVETGTYRGYSTELVAIRKPQLPVFTVEVVDETYRRAKRALDRYANIAALLGSSDVVLRQLVTGGKLGAMPLFYLDAHWQHYWPLRDELRAIGEAGGTAVIVIDDFQVPGQPQFGFDIDGGGERTEGQACSLDYIRPALNPSNDCHVLFPRYSINDAFASGRGQIRGHVVLFQNLAAEYQSFAHRPLAQKHYFQAAIS